jgi:hypothetical protein
MENIYLIFVLLITIVLSFVAYNIKKQYKQNKKKKIIDVLNKYKFKLVDTEHDFMLFTSNKKNCIIEYRPNSDHLIMLNYLNPTMLTIHLKKSELNKNNLIEKLNNHFNGIRIQGGTKK